MVWGLVAGGALGALGSRSDRKAAKAQAAAANYWNKKKEPYLTEGWDAAKDSFKDALDMGPAYDGERVAGLHDFQRQGANSAGQYAGGFGSQGVNALSQGGLDMFGAGQQFAGNAQGLYGMAGQDPTQSIINNASQYANNPHVDGVIDAAGRDVTRNLYENQLPGLNRAATGTGNMNSTRAGVQQAIAERSAGERLADISSNIRGQFFQNGLGMAQNQHNQNFQNQMSANDQLRQGAGMGMDSMYRGQNMAANNFDMMNAAGGMYQNQQQRVNDANQQQWNDQRYGNLNLAQQYAGIFGDVTPMQAPQQTASPLQGALSGAMMGHGFGQKLGGFGGGSDPYTASTNAAMGIWG